MSFDVEDVLEQMAEAINNEVKNGVGDIKVYAKEIMEKEKESLRELGTARVTNQISDEVFNREIEREKKVVEAELLTMQIMTKALAQRAVNAALKIFVNAVRAAI